MGRWCSPAPDQLLFALLPLVSGNNTRAAARSKIGLSKWDILAFKCTARMGVFALILSSLSLRRERMEKTGMFSCGVKPGPGLLWLDWGWEVLAALLGCQCSIPQHPAAQTMEKDVFLGKSRCFPLHCKGGCRERRSHPLPWIQMRVSYQAPLTPHENSQLVLCYFSLQRANDESTG